MTVESKLTVFMTLSEFPQCRETLIESSKVWAMNAAEEVNLAGQW